MTTGRINQVTAVHKRKAGRKTRREITQFLSFFFPPHSLLLRVRVKARNPGPKCSCLPRQIRAHIVLFFEALSPRQSFFPTKFRESDYKHHFFGHEIVEKLFSQKDSGYRISFPPFWKSPQHLFARFF